MCGANSFGKKLVLTTFGESHGPALGSIIDGCPAGVPWQNELLRCELERRRPGSSDLVSARAEKDEPEVLSGVFNGRTLGTPIALVVRNHDARPEDYKDLIQDSRPGHADDVWVKKFGVRDHRGGGRSSGRETVARVMGGAVAKMFLRQAAPLLKIMGFASAIGPLHLKDFEIKQLIEGPQSHSDYPADIYVARFPSLQGQDNVSQLLSEAKAKGKSYGGVATLYVSGVPPGLGQPVFHKLKADLASALMSVGATAFVEIGAGFMATQAEGSEFHKFYEDPQGINPYGGIRGGISTGEPLFVHIGFKPTSTVLDKAKKGRHDPCIVPRALPVLEAMTALVLADHLLLQRSDRA